MRAFVLLLLAGVAAGAPKAPAARIEFFVREHRTWLALEASDTDNLSMDYGVLCKIAAELLGDDVVALYFPARKAWIPGDAKDLVAKLRNKDPLKALGIGVTADEQRKAEIARLRARATDEARKRFREFKDAFRKRKKTGATTFSVAFRGFGGKEQSIAVKEIKGRRMRGFMLSDNMADWDKTVEEYQILDWSYRVGSKHHGNFRLRAAQAYLRKKLQKQR